MEKCCHIMSLTIDTTCYSSFWALSPSSLDARNTLWTQKVLQWIAGKGVTKEYFSLVLLGKTFPYLLA